MNHDAMRVAPLPATPVSEVDAAFETMRALGKAPVETLLIGLATCQLEQARRAVVTGRAVVLRSGLQGPEVAVVLNTLAALERELGTMGYAIDQLLEVQKVEGSRA